MKRAALGGGVALAALCVVLLVAWWRGASAGRDGGGETRAVAERPERELESAELERASAPAAEAADERAEATAAPRESSRDALAPAERERPPRARVRGRVVVAETGDPIEETLSIRLRTLDLAQKESIVTGPDGAFASRQEFGGGVLLALVGDEDGDELCDHEAPFDPQAQEEWLVPVRARAYPTTAVGRVVDSRGEPLEEVLVQLVPRGAELPYAADDSGRGGRFALAGLRAGGYRLLCKGRWTQAEPVDVVLRAGTNELGELVLAEPREAELRVRFVLETEGDEPCAALRVRSADGFEALGSGRPLEDGGGVRLIVPAGRGTIDVVSMDGREYAPERLEYSAPGEVEVRVRGEVDYGPDLVVVDAESGVRLDEFSVWMHELGCWHGRGFVLPGSEAARSYHEPPDKFELGRADRWIVYADGYRAHRGTSDGSEGRIEVALEHGTGVVHVLEDLGGLLPEGDFAPKMAPIAGVEVFAGERRLGESDADGVFVLEEELAAEELGFRRAGWRVATRSDNGVIRVGCVREE